MGTTYCVYKHTNSINGKTYIGITSQNPTRRWDCGRGYIKNKHFWDAIQKYGWDSFTHEILYSGLSKDDAFYLEKELISLYDSQNYRRGYNIAPGGESGPGFSGENHPMWGKHHSGDVRAKISASKRGVPYSPERYETFMEKLDRDALRDRAYRTIVGYNKGRHFSEETRKRIAESNGGLRRSEETRQKISESMKKGVSQFSTNGEFIRDWDCAKSATEVLGIQSSHISKVCNGQRKTAGGFVWRFKK